MKTIFQNKAIISYVEFMRKVIDLKKNPNDEKTKELYHKFINRYREMKNDKEIRASVSYVRISAGLNTDSIKIYYVDMPQLWAFIHLVLETLMKKELSLSFGYYKKDDFLTIKKELKKLWFIKQNQSSTVYIYLEDENNKVDMEIKLYHSRLGIEQCEDNLEKTKKYIKATQYKAENCFKFA